MREASRRFGVSRIRQTSDLVRLRAGRSRLGMSDYFQFRLFDREFTGGWHPERYVGWRDQQRLAALMNDRRGTTAAWDKLTFYALCRTLGLPHPEVLAVFDPSGRRMQPGIPTLRNLVDAEGFLAEAPLPLFGKPSYGQQSLGNFQVLAYDRASRRVQLDDAGWVELDGLCGAHLAPTGTELLRPELGVLFQATIDQHPEITRITAHETISGLRVVYLNTPRHRGVIRVVWKIIGGDARTDNFREGRLGNLVASVDPGSGRVEMAIDGLWPSGREVSHHPTTGEPLTGRVLPMWGEVLALVERAAGAFPMMGLQHWDVVLGRKGPLLLELNDPGGTAWLQFFGEGLLVPPLSDELKGKLRTRV